MYDSINKAEMKKSNLTWQELRGNDIKADTLLAYLT